MVISNEVAAPVMRRKIPALPVDRTTAILSYNKDRLGFLYTAAREHGPIVELWPKTFLVTGPAEVHDVLRDTNRKATKDRDLRLRKSKVLPGTTELANWMSTRRAIIGSMTNEVLGEHSTWLANETSSLAEQLARSGRVSNLTEVVETLTSRSIARFCFGTRDASSIPRAARTALDALFPIFSSSFEFPAYLKALQPREWAASKGLRQLHRCLHAVATSAGHGGIVDVLKSSGADEKDIVGTLTSIILAAHRVSASAISWAVVELAQNPGEQQRAATAARQEWVPGSQPRSLERVVDEALRLWPPSWITDRAIAGESACGLWTLPAHSRVFLPFWVIHRVADCFLDADRFDTGRWEGAPPPPGAYAPFGGGPRRCLGAHFAYMEMMTILAVLLRSLHFDIEGDVVPDARSTLSPTGYELRIGRCDADTNK